MSPGLSAKQARWKELLAKACDTGDKLGMGIDEGILPVIVGLWANGVDTTGSCEGHLTHGDPHPWIYIERFAPEEWGNMDDWWKDERKKAALRKMNKPSAQKTFSLLTKFYRNRRVPYSNQLVLTMGNHYMGNCTLEPTEGSLHRLLPTHSKKTRLKAYQKEMRAFGKFLKKEYFAST